MGTSYNTNVVSDGLIGYWDAANRRSYPGAGITWTDLVGVNNGTLENRDGAATTLPSFDSNWQGVIEFDGTDDQVNLGDDKFIPQGTLPVTVNYWVHPTDYPSGSGSSRYFGIRLKHGADPGELFMIWRPRGGTSALYWGFRNQASMRVANDTGYNIEDWFNQWVNITWIYFGGTYSTAGNYAVYFNGLPATHYSGGTIGAPTQQRNVISNAHDWYGHFEGYIANVAIWNRGLTAAEVKQNYEAIKPRFTPRIAKSGLVGNWDAGDPESYPGGTTLKDTANGTAATFSNMNGSNFNSANGGYWEFDGTNEHIQCSTNSVLQPQSFSVEAWAKESIVDGELDALPIVTWKSGGTKYPAVYTSYHTAQKPIIFLSGSDYRDFDKTAVSVAGWHHVMFTYTYDDVTTSAFYVDGVSIAAATTDDGTKDSTDACDIGRGGGLYYKGSIALVRIYDNALSAAEVMENYQATRARFGL